MMRTTITIDDDIASALKPLLKKQGGKLKVVINSLLRKGLGLHKKKKVEITTVALNIHTGIDHTHFNRIAGELLDQDLIKKL